MRANTLGKWSPARAIGKLLEGEKRGPGDGPHCESRPLSQQKTTARLSHVGPARYLRLVLRFEAFKGLTLPACWLWVSALAWVAKLQTLVFHLAGGLG